MTGIFLLLISAALGILTVNELELSLTEPNIEIGKDVYVNPASSLNLLHGFMYKEKRQIHKKRLFSPGFKTNYSLKKDNESFVYNRIGSKDVANVFDESGSLISKYLAMYYKAVKTMYNVVNGEVNIHTYRYESLYKFLTQTINERERFQLLAAMLLVAEGVEVPLSIDKRTIKYKDINRKISVIRYKKEKNEESLFEMELYTIIKMYRVRENDETYIEKQFHELTDIINLIKFFINYGGDNKRKLDSYKLSPDDTPSFLIRSYVFEFIKDLEDARKFFKAVNDLLVYTNNGKDSETWKIFFTTNNEEVKKYKPVYRALKEVDRVISEIGFPFSVYSLPPGHVQVKGYNRKKKNEITNPKFNLSDCCDITIYSLFCCLLYKPSDNIYSLEKMVKNGYKPTEELKEFFEKFYTKPTGTASYHLHQQWTHVIQDLFLNEGELMGRDDNFEKNSIKYCTSEDIDGELVEVEVKTEILNVLKILAKVIGMPKDKMRELGEICAMVQSGRNDVYEIQEIIIEYLICILNEISVMDVEVDIKKMEISSEEGLIGVYGDIEIRFIPMEDNTLLDVEHVVCFYLREGHGEAKIVSENNEIKTEDREILEKLVEECKAVNLELGGIVVKSVCEFLNWGKFKPVPQNMIEKVEQAGNDMEKYLAINDILNISRIVTIDDKLYLIDLFSPYLDEMTNGNSGNKEQTMNAPNLFSIKTLSQNPKEHLCASTIKDNELSSNDPAVQLISNIIGSVPLDDELTQYLFVQIFASCNGKYKDLFLNIQGDIEITSVFTHFGEGSSFNLSYFNQLNRRNMPNILKRIIKGKGNSIETRSRK